MVAFTIAIFHYSLPRDVFKAICNESVHLMWPRFNFILFGCNKPSNKARFYTFFARIAGLFVHGSPVSLLGVGYVSSKSICLPLRIKLFAPENSPHRFALFPPNKGQAFLDNRNIQSTTSNHIQMGKVQAILWLLHNLGGHWQRLLLFGCCFLQQLVRKALVGTTHRRPHRAKEFHVRILHAEWIDRSARVLAAGFHLFPLTINILIPFSKSKWKLCLFYTP